MIYRTVISVLKSQTPSWADSFPTNPLAFIREVFPASLYTSDRISLRLRRCAPPRLHTDNRHVSPPYSPSPGSASVSGREGHSRCHPVRPGKSRPGRSVINVLLSGLFKTEPRRPAAPFLFFHRSLSRHLFKKSRLCACGFITPPPRESPTHSD